ncbi:BnaAnng35690D [Brassica napus]|uniref:BnaAnng35690D protein n=1 Tax=Brassica napus TaxID=3708 RepID=A0A078JW30_BRANA|nr:BnaAnng35690D [Brassica napus]
MGGRTSVEEEVLCQFTFPERAGALMNFLDSFSPRWNIFINIITHIVVGFSFVGDIDTSAPFESIRSSRRTIEEGLERVNSAKMEAEEEEETQWQWSERRRRSSSSYKGKYTNRRETVLMDVNCLDMMMNGDGTASSVAVLKPAMSIGQILGRKLLLANESAMMINGRVSLGQIL